MEKSGDRIHVIRPNLPSREKLDRYIDGIYERRYLTNNGPLVQELTRKLEAYLGVRNLVLVSSGTVALDIALYLVNPKHLVHTTPFSFPATSSSIQWRGLKSVYSDISSQSFNISPVSLENALREQAAPILATHVFGNPCEVSRLDDLAAAFDVPVVYDAAHSFGVQVNSQSVLSFGDISVLSFHATKLFNTIEGGALIVSDNEMFELANRAINFGFDEAGLVKQLGVNAKMNEFEAAVGLCLLDEMDHILGQLQGLYESYRENLSPRLQLQELDQNCNRYNHSYMPVCFESSEQRERVEQQLQAQNILSRRYFYPSLDTVSVFGGNSDCHVSQDIADRILCLPMYATLGVNEAERIADIVNSVVDKLI